MWSVYMEFKYNIDNLLLYRVQVQAVLKLYTNNYTSDEQTYKVIRYTQTLSEGSQHHTGKV